MVGKGKEIGLFIEVWTNFEENDFLMVLFWLLEIFFDHLHFICKFVSKDRSPLFSKESGQKY